MALCKTRRQVSIHLSTVLEVYGAKNNMKKLEFLASVGTNSVVGYRKILSMVSELDNKVRRKLPKNYSSVMLSEFKRLVGADFNNKEARSFLSLIKKDLKLLKGYHEILLKTNNVRKFWGKNNISIEEAVVISISPKHIFSLKIIENRAAKIGMDKNLLHRTLKKLTIKGIIVQEDKNFYLLK